MNLFGSPKAKSQKPKAKSQKRTAKSQKRTANSQKRTAKSPKRTAKSQKRTAKSQKRTANSRKPLLNIINLPNLANLKFIVAVSLQQKQANHKSIVCAYHRHAQPTRFAGALPIKRATLPYCFTSHPKNKPLQVPTWACLCIYAHRWFAVQWVSILDKYQGV